MTAPTAPTTEPVPETVQAAAQRFPAGAPLLMVNLLRFRDVAAYGKASEVPAASGREAYFGNYLPAFNRIAADKNVEGVEVVFAGQVHAAVIAPPSEHWDLVAIVRYPDFAAFRRVAESPEYAQHAYPHRAAALADLRLIATTAFDPSA